jgi:hypothetical protein
MLNLGLLANHFDSLPFFTNLMLQSHEIELCFGEIFLHYRKPQNRASDHVNA